MTQEINLLKTLEIKKYLFSARWIFVMAIVWLLLLVGMGLLFWLNSVRYEVTLTKVQFEQGALEKQLTILASKRSLEATATVNHMKKAKEDDLAASPAVNTEPGFAEYLTVLAKCIPQGVWLKHIVLMPDKRQYLFSGEVLHKVLVSNFISALTKDQIFAQEKFNTLRLVKNSNDENFAFTLSSEVAKDQNHHD